MVAPIQNWPTSRPNLGRSWLKNVIVLYESTSLHVAWNICKILLSYPLKCHFFDLQSKNSHTYFKVTVHKRIYTYIATKESGCFQDPRFTEYFFSIGRMHHLIVKYFLWRKTSIYVKISEVPGSSNFIIGFPAP